MLRKFATPPQFARLLRSAISRYKHESTFKNERFISRLLCMIISAVAIGNAKASDINVLSASAYQDWNFTTNSAFSTLRSDLLNSALFGNSGVVNRSVNFLPGTTSVTVSQLAVANVVLYHAAGQIYTSADVALLKPFVESGGGLFVFGNAISDFAGIVGSLDSSRNWVYGSTATVSNSNSPLVQGPFGNLAVGTQFYVPTHCVLNSTGPNADVGVNESAGNFAMTYQIGQGRVVLIGDEEIFMNSYPGFSADPRLTNTTRLLFQNAFAYVATVPEPSAYALGLIAAGAMAWLARQSKGALYRA